MKLYFRKKGRSVEERFYNFISPEPNSGCWLWLGPLSGSGYGRMTINKKGVQAHRVAWEINNGKIPDGLFACHTCDVRCCVNPAHLFLGTQSDNLQDMVNKKRDNPRRGERHGKARFSETQIAAIRADMRSLAQIASEYGVDKQYIHRIKKGKHWRHSLGGMSHENDRIVRGRKIRARGETHWKAKLNNNAVFLIRKDERSSRELAKVFGVSKTTVLRIKQRKNWEHI